MYKVNKLGGYIRLSDNAFIPNDPANTDYQAVLAWLAAGNSPQPEALPSIEDLIKANINEVQIELDRVAQEKGYDNILSACSYAADVNAFQAEGQAFLKWRSDAWAQAYSVLSEVQAGTRPLPTPEEAVAMLPALVLP